MTNATSPVRIVERLVCHAFFRKSCSSRIPSLSQALYAVRSIALVALLGIAAASASPAEEIDYSVKKSVAIYVEPFKETQHEIDGCTFDTALCRIDGRVPFGVDHEMPRSTLVGIRVLVGGEFYDLDTSNMYNPDLGRDPVSIGQSCILKDVCTFRGVFSDAAGAYAAEWIVSKGISTRTVLSNSKDIVTHFLKNPKAPTYE